jgi:hypothetical protein
VEDEPDEVGPALDAADAAWATVGGSARELGGASVALIRAVVERRAGRPAAAIDRATDGLTRLERGRTGSGTPSRHMAAALAAEWISALLDAGRTAEAQDGCSALLPRLSEQARPTRQLALLRLTVARTVAAQDDRADTAQLLAQAAADAAGSDVPDLEAVCRTALGALLEQADRLDIALEELQLAVGAERRDRARSRRFLAAMAELMGEPAAERRRERADPGTSGDSDSTTLLPVVTRKDRKIRTSRLEERSEQGPRDPGPDEPGPGADSERPAAWDATPWNGSMDDSPIGDLLIRSMRGDSAEASDTGVARRNGKSHGAPAFHSDDESARRPRNGRTPGTESADSAGGRAARRRDAERSDAMPGWMPELDSDRSDRAGERRTRGRRRDRSADADRGNDSWRRARHGGTGGSDGIGERPTYGRHGGSDDADDAADRPANDPGGTRSRPETSPERDRPDDEGRSWATRSGRILRPVHDPWATGRWSVRPDPHGERETAPPANETVEPAAEETTSAETTSAVADSDGWLESALAELDRTLSGIGLGESARAEERPRDDGCAVVVDIARDGRRFAGPRAAAVVRSIADLLAGHLPAGTQSRFGDADALVVSGPGWSRADATDWMHRTLPGLLDGFVAGEEFPGAQLRVAVHDADGPVGAQILQPLAPPGRERAAADEGRYGGGDRGREPWDDHSTPASETRGREYRAAARAGRQGREGSTRARRELESEPTEPPAGDGDFRRWPWSGANARTGLEPLHNEPDEPGHEAPDPEPGTTQGPAREAGSSGRHGAGSGRSTMPARGEVNGRGSRHRAGPQERTSGERGETNGSGLADPRDGREPGRNGAERGTRASGSAAPDPDAKDNAKDDAEPGVTSGRAGEPADRKPDRPESTEGLGIADLLAGALAAYRGI